MSEPFDPIGEAITRVVNAHVDAQKKQLPKTCVDTNDLTFVLQFARALVVRERERLGAEGAAKKSPIITDLSNG